MGARLLPASLLFSVALADAAGAHGLAFYILLGAITAIAVSALAAYGTLVDLPGSAAALTTARLNAILLGFALVLSLVAAAVRAPALAEGAVPALGLSALVGALCLLLVHGAFAVGSTR